MCAGIQPVLRDTGYVNGNVAVLMGMGCINGNGCVDSNGYILREILEMVMNLLS